MKPYNEALQLRNEIIKLHHIKKWNLLTAPSQPLSRIKNNISTKVIDKSKHVQAIKALKRRRFSFSFYRSSNKHQQQHGQSLCHQTIGNKVIELLKSCDLIAGELQDFLRYLIKGNLSATILTEVLENMLLFINYQ